MNNIRDIIELLQDTDSAISRINRALQESPDNEALRINAESIERRRSDLIRRLNYLLHTQHNEFIQYKVEKEVDEFYPAKSIAMSIQTFQELFTAIFDAIKDRPKQRYRPSAENEEISAFNFAGAYSGSVILAFSVPEERLLVGETDFEISLDYVKRTLSAKSDEELQNLSKKVGIASISKAHAWAVTSTRYGLSTKINWGRSLADLQTFDVSAADASMIMELIENKSDETHENIEVDCVLVGFDAEIPWFHIRTLEYKQEIKGSVDPRLSTSWTTDMSYRADLIRTTRIIYATGEQKVHWTLMDLKLLTLSDK